MKTIVAQVIGVAVMAAATVIALSFPAQAALASNHNEVFLRDMTEG